MSTRRRSARTSNEESTSASAVASTSAVKLPAKAKPLQMRPVGSKGKGKAPAAEARPRPPAPQSTRKIARYDAAAVAAMGDDGDGSPERDARPVKRLKLAAGLDGGNLETELASERGKAKVTPLSRPPPKIDFLTFKPRPRPRPSSHLPTSPPRSASARTHVSSSAGDSLVAIPVTETPVARKNKEMRMENARRSSLTLRSSRMSSSLTRGEVVMPHPSVGSQEFYKHLSPTLPEPIRVKNLLLWCAKRTKVPKARGDTAKGDELCQKIMEGMVEMIGRGRINLNVFAGDKAANSAATLSLKPHPQNVLNAERKAREEAHIDLCKRESEQWNAIGKRANAKHADVVKALHSKKEPELDGEEWISQASRVADEILAQTPEDLGERGDVEFKVDTLLQTTHTAMQYSLHATRFLDGVFSSLTQDLRDRGKAGAQAKSDPLTLLRAMARADAPHASQETIAAATAIAPVTMTPRRPGAGAAVGMTPSRRGAATPRGRGTPYRS